MLFFNKKRILACALLLCLLVCACVPLSAFSRAAQALPFTVVIDAGHGGVDGGVLGVRTKVKESDLNLQIAQLLRERFAQAGVRAVRGTGCAGVCRGGARAGVRAAAGIVRGRGGYGG